MKNFVSAIVVLCAGACVASCDLQPKITALPDSVGDFISARYPAMLADPNTEPEIYNSAVTDYGVYASPELYGSGALDEYVNYVGVDDYILKPEPESVASAVGPEPVVKDASVRDAPKAEPKPESKPEPEPEAVPDDVLNIPEYEPGELNVPARAAVGNVVVRRGDTLYSIARENNTTVADLARMNNLKEPYVIKIGQSLKLKPAAPVESKPVVKTTEQKPTEQKPATKPVAEKPVSQPEPKVEKKVETKPAEKPTTKPAVQPATKPEPEKPKSVDVRVPLKTITVARGDTLYSLSRRYEIPVNDLAVMNKLTAPFALNVGQKLRVPDLPDAKPSVTTVAPSKAAAQPKTTTPKKSSTAKTTTDTKSKKPVEKTTQKKTEVKKPEQKTTTKTKASASQPIAARSSSRFTWPVRGTILSHYGAKSGGLYNDGINISAAAGATVVAAENGVVAYAGNEVRGMGNLIIIQHADGWMTVYAHLNSMSVRRGARVNVGQKIGTVGQTGKVTKPQLHFEIRKGTKSYNPTNYLKK